MTLLYCPTASAIQIAVHSIVARRRNFVVKSLSIAYSLAYDGEALSQPISMIYINHTIHFYLGVQNSTNPIVALVLVPPLSAYAVRIPSPYNKM